LILVIDILPDDLKQAKVTPIYKKGDDVQELYQQTPSLTIKFKYLIEISKRRSAIKRIASTWFVMINK
jgi:hypothetical protein